MHTRGRKRPAVHLNFELCEDRMLLTTFTVNSAADPVGLEGTTTLRQAIDDSNATPGPNTIDFNIPGPGVHTISLASPLPPIVEAVTIDGTSQGGYAGKPLITLTPATTPGGAAVFAGDGLDIYAGGTTVQGLNIAGFQGNGVLLAANGNNVLQSNYIGTDQAGTAAVPNQYSGVAIEGSPGNDVTGNLISGNSGDGITISNNNTLFLSQSLNVSVPFSETFSPTDSFTYQTIGTINLQNYAPAGQGYTLQLQPGLTATLQLVVDTSGPTPQVSGQYTFPSFTAQLVTSGQPPVTVSSTAGATVPIVGTLTPSGPSTYTLNASFDLSIPFSDSSGLINGVYSNYGLVPGTVTFVDSTPTTFTNQLGDSVGRNTALVSGLVGPFGNSALNNVDGNYIGTNASGDNLGNAGDGVGIFDEPNNTIGGANTIGFNTDGIDITGSGATGNVVLGNSILVNGDGVLISDAPSNTIGGAGNAANTIGFNTDGIEIIGSGATGNVVQGNYIGTNASGGKLGNGVGVLITGAPSDTISGANTIGFNTDGIEIIGSGATGNAVQGNYIGTNATGKQALGNGDGVLISDAPSNTIGGAGNAANTIGFNTDGIEIIGPGATGNVVLGNYIGTNASGANLGNTGAGVLIDNLASKNTIGPANTIGRNGTGIDFESGATANLVLGNFIGTDPTGTVGRGNTLDGILLNDASNNRIIGNVVSGNGIGPNGINQDAAGINLESNDSNNIIAGNEIGTNAAGDAMLGNSLHGIFLGNGSSNNTIGGPTDNDRNVISGNGQFPVANLATQGSVGVYIYGANTSGNVVQGNYIGTNAAGNDALTNSVIGVLISQSSGNTVQGNLISGNRLVGLEIAGGAGGTASGNLLQGNLIGTDAGGTRAVPNGLDGIFISDAPNNSIGGTTAGAGNLISGNGSVGIQLFGPLTRGNVVQGNALGLNSAGRPTLPNRMGGIFVNTGPLNNKIGGTAPGQANRGQSRPLYTVSGSQQSDPGSTAQTATAAGRRFRIRGRARTSLRAHSTAH